MRDELTVAMRRDATRCDATRCDATLYEKSLCDATRCDASRRSVQMLRSIHQNHVIQCRVDGRMDDVVAGLAGEVASEWVADGRAGGRIGLRASDGSVQRWIGGLGLLDRPFRGKVGSLLPRVPAAIGTGWRMGGLSKWAGGLRRVGRLADWIVDPQIG